MYPANDAPENHKRVMVSNQKPTSQPLLFPYFSSHKYTPFPLSMHLYASTYNVYFIHSHKSIKIIVGKFINSNKHVGVYSTEQRTLTLTKEEENNLIECHIWTTRSYGCFSKRSKVLKELENTLALHLMEFVFHSRLPLPSNNNKKTSNERRKHVIVSI